MARLIALWALRVVLGIALLALIYIGLGRADAVDWQALVQPPRQSTTAVATEAPIVVTVVIVEAATSTPPPTETAPTATIVPPTEAPVATATNTAIPTETPTVEPTPSPTEEECICLRKTPVPTATATEAPTEEPSLTPTEEDCPECLPENPVPTPTQIRQAAVETAKPIEEPKAKINWKVVEADSNQPINQAQVWLAFNQRDPAQIFWTNENGEINVDFDRTPKMGKNDLGYVVSVAPGLERTEVWFRLDNRRLVLLDDQGRDLNGTIELHAQTQVPSDLDESKVWAGCDDRECMTEIALTSGYFQLGQKISCKEAKIDNSFGTYQRYRARNGLSVVGSTPKHLNFVGPGWPDGGENLAGWKCGNQEEEIFLVSGCGNIAFAVLPPE